MNNQRNNRFIDPKEDISNVLFEDGTKVSDKNKKLMEIEYLLNNNFSETATNKETALAKKDVRTPKNKIKKSTKVICVLLAIATLLFGAFVGYKYFYLDGKNIVKTEWGDIVLDVPQSQEMVNALLIGFDEGGYRTDTMMIINFNPKTSAVNLISIPRDTLIGINGKRMKLNAAFAIGKFDLTIKSIRQLTGMPIHYYVAVDTKGFRSVIDTLGGVDFEVERDLKYSDPVQGLHIDLKKGFQHLDGDKAEQLVRYRKYVMGDLDREDVQKKFIKALIEQKLTVSNLADLSKIKGLYQEIATYSKTNAGFNDIMRYFVSALKIKSENFKTYTLPGVPKNINGVSYFVYNKSDSANLFKQIYGADEKPQYTVAEGIQLYDTEGIGQTAKTAGTEGEKTGTGSSKPSSESSNNTFNVEKIQINDGNDSPYTEVGEAKPIEQSNQNTNDFQLEEESTNSTDTTNTSDNNTNMSHIETYPENQ